FDVNSHTTPCGPVTCSGAQMCEVDKCVCSDLHCKVKCEHGFKKDDNGCEYACICADAPQ
uniref:Bdellastasin n=2 Tax=Hirudo TaxID=6420 RepID=BDEL_HIRME|nr:RecName: Full=Bdellastasin; AltName: Full=Bdellin A [Hirudo medicinalis]1C9P_B Chain B, BDELLASTASIN [Hirudo medicinalis]1C9T_G Chain G, Bdellastasin [Hirudo medicinalis]1C9T_H Chain H, Bdellastasin [Hirudo medicinalis]1C9T_I Chain I, Bdellastasin [Hirudo medicinalis]1C9T_J Chain J, Bdellastasin [Hirudo medicinalis]1C9T_K Chain K, Bdellastasin [Hirudo medicinalis]1C9T_L Chain L, Bdellastasin [Hirudo medicinalis]1EJA_B Chain B, Bdellastasin [Hirudo medicinalis]